MGVFATLSDVQLRYEGVIPTADDARITARIDDAEGLLTALIPSLLDPVKTDAARSARAKSVVCDAVLRVYRNPGGFRSEGMETDNAARSSAAESGLIQFTPDELQSLRLRSKKRGLGTIKLGAWNPVRNAVDATQSDGWPRTYRGGF
jgi:hypothetical protein